MYTIVLSIKYQVFKKNKIENGQQSARDRLVKYNINVVLSKPCSGLYHREKTRRFSRYTVPIQRI